jgi:hypothetical protein
MVLDRDLRRARRVLAEADRIGGGDRV